jgi:hypothetical protein
VPIRIGLLGGSLSHEICHEVRGEGLAHGRLLLCCDLPFWARSG